jgi:uncharacterized protein YbgA (DUF1722 family)/uncharacterized protein YbbK (DUF523 family)|tara:strand:- start:608 stop:1564 length:957 start_codon:yes stop_codon:yes gene_type:complete
MNGEGLEKIKIGISSCLMGEKVRFDSGHKRNAYINGILANFFEFTTFCPEVEIGLSIPREPIRLVTLNDKVHCVGTRNPELDVTEDLYKSADEQQAWHRQLCGYILKKGSPSCGMERVRLYKGDIPDRIGVGLYAERLMQNFPNLPVEEEGRLEDPVLRENFIQRVYIYSRWQNLMEQAISMKSLTLFHAQHKYIYMSHDQSMARQLGSWLAESHKTDLDTLTTQYPLKMMTLLKRRATRKNHVNTLQHIQGYLKNHLDAGDKQELTTNIKQYREGLLPLIVPITLLRHHFRRYPNNYISNSYYMQPHPAELMLLNSL